MFTISRFHEILKYFPRSSFEKLVKKHGSDKYSKGFGSWAHLVAMLYGQLSGASSLRTLEAGFNSQCPHYHLGVRPVRRSTLFDANARRSPEVFAEAAQWLMTQLKRDVRNQMKQALCLLDSTSLTLKGKGFDVWTLDQRTRNTQGIKLHLLFEAHTASPLACSMTPANVNDRDEGVRLTIEPGAIYVFDKGYCDYTWWHDIHQAGATFVTRFKKNARLSGSQIQHPQAIVASHLFFGASEKPSAILTSLFATHPPIEERIQRLGGEALPLPVVMDYIMRDITPGSVALAQVLLANLPETLRQAASSAFDATGIVCGLFLSTTQPKLRLRQEKLLSPAMLPMAQALNQWLSEQTEQGAQYRLVWLDLALPTLREAPESERQQLLAWAKALIRADRRVSLSECALYSILQNTLLPPSKRSPLNREPLYRLVARVLALIAYAGHEDVEMAKAAYQAAMAHSPARKEVPFPDREAWSLPVFSQTLLYLALAAPSYRKKFLEACAVAAQHDGKITPVENELLRAFAQSLDCPAPLV